jgi:hypothetical protein
VLINLIILAKTQKENNNLTMRMILDEQHTFINNRGLPIISICEHLVGIKIKTDKRKYRRLKLESIRLFGTPTNLNISAWLYTLVLHFSVYTWKKRDNVPVSLTDTTTNNENDHCNKLSYTEYVKLNATHFLCLHLISPFLPQPPFPLVGQ